MQEHTTGRLNPPRRHVCPRSLGILIAVTLTAFPALAPAPVLAVVIDPPLDPEDAATDWRWIGLVADGAPSPTCGSAADWTERLLFDPGDGSAVPPGLQRFCVYEAIDPAADSTQLEDLVKQGHLTALERDHMAVGSQADELRGAVYEELRRHFLDQAGAVAMPQSSGVAPRLAFLDTAPTNEVDPENGWTDSSPHGYTLINIARELLCDISTEGCVAKIVSRLTLAHKDLTPMRDSVNGGYIGTIGELAEAIRREVNVWRQAGAVEPLILDLSLGWPGELFGGGAQVVADMPLDVQAVHDAIRDAVCRGVLIVAAAGNAAGGPDPAYGPLYPAAWEARPAPSSATCAGALELGAHDPTLWPAGYWPLVYAAGGVGETNAPLVNARDGGEPRLVAFADHAIVQDPRPGPTTIATGTSVSAVVVATAAAAAWHVRPGDKVHEIMEIVYQAGDNLGRVAGFCLGGAGCLADVHRVSVCQTAHDACAIGGTCPPLPACATPQPFDLSSVDFNLFLASASTYDLSMVTGTSTFPECLEDQTVAYEVPPEDPCPHWQYHGMAIDIVINPQPGSNPCPSCLIGTDSPLMGKSATGTLYFEIDSEFQSDLTDPTLIVGSNAYNLSAAGPFIAGSKLLVTGVPDPGSSPAFLSFTVGGEQSTISPLLVVDP